jgi:hypothetical protein
MIRENFIIIRRFSLEFRMKYCEKLQNYDLNILIFDFGIIKFLLLLECN